MRVSLFIFALALGDEIKSSRSHHLGWGITSPPACLATSRKGRRKPSSTTAGGFGSQEPQTVESKKEEEKSNSADPKRIYSMPALYDLAFGYRNHEEEVNFLVGQHQALHQGKSPERVLELAAGPARHSIYALQSSQVKAATALDNAPKMIEYGKTIAMEELDVDSQDNFEYVQHDMSDFQLSDDELFDTAWILLGSLQHLTTNDQVISCFKSINKVLTPGGSLILELPHPRETFSLVECTRNGWEIPLEDDDGAQSGELAIVWGDDGDDFDPIKQIRQFTVKMELKGVENEDPNLQNLHEVVPLRHFTSQEIDALARIAGFQVASMHGALADGVDVNDEDEAFRLVCVLKKSV